MFEDEPQLLEVDHVSKLYSRNPGATRTRLAATSLRALFGQRARPISTLNKGEFWAVNDLSFSVARGQAIGIIGRNGSGKTTLLRMLSGQILPDKGEIRLRGSAAAMIDLTAGFQGTASGRENIFLRGALLGRSREQMLAALDEIIEFAELGDAIEAPVMTYSSGMMMRLAFSIMVAVTPDILVIDEILAVGDFRFRQKCLEKLRAVRTSSAIVFVSHNMDDVARFCDRCILLEAGCIAFFGEPKEAIRCYENDEKERRPPSTSDPLHSRRRFEIERSPLISSITGSWVGDDGQEIFETKSCESLRFICQIVFTQNLRNLSIGIPIFTSDGTYLTMLGIKGLVTDCSGEMCAVHTYEVRVPKLILNPGTYYSQLIIRDGLLYLCRIDNSPITVIKGNLPGSGLVALEQYWSVGDRELKEKQECPDPQVTRTE